MSPYNRSDDARDEKFDPFGELDKNPGPPSASTPPPVPPRRPSPPPVNHMYHTDPSANSWEGPSTPPASEHPQERNRANDDARQMAGLCYLVSFSSWVGVPFGNLVGPLIVWMIKRDEYQFVDEHGRQVINANISFYLFGLLLIVGSVASLATAPDNLEIFGVVLLVGALWYAVNLIATIVGTIKAFSGKPFRFPFIINFI